MVTGKVLVIGAMTVDGEQLTGMFIECSVDNLRKGRNMFAETVAIVPPAQIKVDSASSNTVSDKIAALIAKITRANTRFGLEMSATHIIDELRQIRA